MKMSPDHKRALAEGRAQARAIKAYLLALESRRPGRPVSRESLQSRLDSLTSQIEAASGLTRVELIQRRLDLEGQMKRIGASEDMEELQRGFVEHAAAYSGKKGISYAAWREAGVSAAVLRLAGIKETRRRG